MKLKALVLIVGVSVLPAIGLFAAAIPAPDRAEASALSDAFFSRLGEWIGGESVRHGAVRLNGLLNMRLEAENVEIKGVRRQGVAVRLKVGKLSAQFNWLGAVTGRPAFSDLTLEDILVAADAPLALEEDAQGLAGPFGMADFAPLLGAGHPGAHGKSTPFPRIRIRDARVVFTSRRSHGRRRRVHPRLNIADMQIEFGPQGSQDFAGNIVWRNQAFALTGRKSAPGPGGNLAGSTLDLSLSGGLFTLSASGELTARPERQPQPQFKGEMTVASTSFAAAAHWLGLALPRTLEAAGEAASVSGSVTWNKHEFSIDGLRAELSRRSVSGILSVKDGPAEDGKDRRLAIEGTLALSSFDASALNGLVLEEDGANAGRGLAGFLRVANADLRVSVNRFSVGGVSGASAALTLLAKDGKLSVDMADMAVLGGRVRGHFSIDASRPQRRLVVRATGADLDSAQLSQVFDAPGWLTGDASVNVEAQAEGRDWAEALRSLNGEADVSFSEGGGVGLDPAGPAGDGRGAHRENQGPGHLNWTGRRSMQFDTLRAELAIDHGRIRSKNFELSAEGKAVVGRCIIDLPGQFIDWRFDVRLMAPLGVDATTGSGGALDAGGLASSVTIKGPWRKPSISVGEPGAKPDCSAGARSHLQKTTPNG
jgi:hypothetical protein